MQAPDPWRRVDFISDLHLQSELPETFELWQSFMRGSVADAIFILGDLFEVWIGDDVLSVKQEAAAECVAFEARCLNVLRDAAGRIPVFFMHGNRDFLLGARFLDDCGVTELADPCLFDFQAQRQLLSHGDALCLNDPDYLRFRSMVRSESWQAEFLAKPLAERQAIARGLRQQSSTRQRTMQIRAEVDDTAARKMLQHAGAQRLIHGHTHRPAAHDLGDGLQRIVLSDWDGAARPPRAEVLRLDASGWQRLELSAARSGDPR